MTADELSPARFGAAFKAFLEAVNQAATPVEGTLHERISEHLGADPSLLPVFSEEFDPYEHPNVQVAIDAYLEPNARSAELIGIAA